MTKTEIHNIAQITKAKELRLISGASFMEKIERLRKPSQRNRCIVPTPTTINKRR